jgi:hypothetical protein
MLDKVDDITITATGWADCASVGRIAGQADQSVCEHCRLGLVVTREDQSPVQCSPEFLLVSSSVGVLGLAPIPVDCCNGMKWHKIVAEDVDVDV